MFTVVLWMYPYSNHKKTPAAKRNRMDISAQQASKQTSKQRESQAVERQAMHAKCVVCYYTAENLIQFQLNAPYLDTTPLNSNKWGHVV
jgi:hypothetical protein